MKLAYLRIRRMPGIDTPFELPVGEGDLVLVVGPNGSGKSTICRAVRALLWPETEREEPIDVVARWHEDEAVLRSDRARSRVFWQRDGADTPAPDLPEARAARCFSLGMRDLLVDNGSTDGDIAGEIRRQMAGGYDVSAVEKELFTVGARHGGNEAKAARAARSKVEEIEQEQRTLAAAEDELDALRADLDDALEEAGKQGALARALVIAKRRAEREGTCCALDAMPEGIERLDGGEGDWLQELDEERERIASERRKCEEKLQEAREIVADVGLDAPPADETLRAWKERCRELTTVERDLRDARDALSQAEAVSLTRRAALDAAGPGADPPRVDAAALNELEGFLRDRVSAAAEQARLDVERAWLDEERARLGDTVAPAEQARTLDRGIEALRGWLAAPDVEEDRLWVVAIVVIALGIALAFALPWAGALVAGTGAGLLLARFLRRGADDRGRRRSEYEALRLTPPASWRVEAVRERLEALEMARHKAVDVEKIRARSAEVDARERAAAKREAALEAQRERLRLDLGVDAGRGDLGIAELARAVSAWRDAEDGIATAQARVTQLEGEVALRRAAIGDFLGVGGGQDAAALASALDALEARCASYVKALDKVAHAEERARELGRGEERLQEKAEKLWRDAGLAEDDREALTRRLNLLIEWQELQEELRAHDKEISRIEAELVGRPELLELNVEEAERKVEAAGAAASAAGDLRDRITEIETKVADARNREDHENAQAALDAAREQLHACREVALQAAAGRLLLEGVRTEYDRASRPVVLQRAMSLFDRFTQHAYTLQIEDGEGDATLRAVDNTSGAGLTLTQLSDGTRMQLLLAARLAFAQHAERGIALPFFLDEVLTTTDPGRFQAVAESLLSLVRDEGRQVFYLTANSGDVAQWRAVFQERGLPDLVPIDLAAQRQLGGSVAGPEALVVAPLPAVPTPGGLEVEEYGALIGVTPFNPYAPLSALHLFHLLRDELPLLYRLLTAGITSFGQWRALSEAGGGAALVGAETAERINALGAVAGIFIEAWHVGRGRPVDGEALEKAEGVSPTFAPRLGALAEELGGDARTLLETIDRKSDERVKGFRQANREQFENWLFENGHLDPRAPLDDGVLRARVLTAVPPALDLETATRRINEMLTFCQR